MTPQRGKPDSRDAAKPCTCHPYDKQANFCAHQHAFSQCQRLIAAAPELLAALHAALNWYTPPNDSGPFPIKQIADAIAKAEGRL